MTQRQPTAVRQRQIAEAALKIISNQGLRRFTTEAIAKEVGISGGTIFRHFPDKNAIADAAFDVAEEILFEGFPPTHPDPITRLGLFFEKRCKTILEHRDIILLVQSEQLAYASTGHAAERVVEWKNRSTSFIMQCLSEARDRGQVRGDVPLEQLAMLVYGSLVGLALADERMSLNIMSFVDGRQLWENIRKLIAKP